MPDDLKPSASKTDPWNFPWLKAWKGPSVLPLMSGVRDSYAATAFSDVLDRSLHAQAAQFTGGFSPLGLWLAYVDWAVHLAVSPGKQTQLRIRDSRCS